MAKTKVFWREYKGGLKLKRASVGGIEFEWAYIESPTEREPLYRASVQKDFLQAEFKRDFASLEEAKAWIISQEPWKGLASQVVLQLDRVIGLPGKAKRG